MPAPIQLSDRVHPQEKSEPRMEAIAFTHEYDRHIEDAWACLKRREDSGGPDLLGIARELQAMRRMTATAYQRIDDLTLEVSKWEGGDAA